MSSQATGFQAGIYQGLERHFYSDMLLKDLYLRTYYNVTYNAMPIISISSAGTYLSSSRPRGSAIALLL